MLIRHVLLIASAFQLPLQSKAVAEPVLVIDTEQGPVKGVVRRGVRAFLGVPYADTTEGANRWAPPQPRRKWTHALDASRFGPGCIQNTHDALSPSNASEDCLNANVFVPLSTSRDLLPVMVWIHGGSFDVGNNEGAALELYDGSHLAQQGVVVIGVNYRLGALGFLSLPERLGTGVKGNFGLMDQRFALQWVQRNAKAFGGDPSRVTVFGESAGAMSIGIHLASNKSDGLFSKAIMQSNVAGVRYKNQEEAAKYGAKFMGAFPNCRHMTHQKLLACLRNTSAAAVIKADDQIPILELIADPRNWGHWVTAGFGFGLVWQPTITGDEPDGEFPVQVQDAFEAGRQIKVPTIAGSNSDEAIAAGLSVNSLEYNSLLTLIFGPRKGELVIKQYPSKGFHASLEPLGSAATDFLFRCPTMRLLRLQALAGQPTFAYRFDHPPSMVGFAKYFDLPTFCEEGYVCHGSELLWVFNNSMKWSYTKAEVKLGQAMMELWTSFARSGTPSSHAVSAKWPTYVNGTERNFVFATSGDGVNVTEESSYNKCRFWDEIGYNHDRKPDPHLAEAIQATWKTTPMLV